jgi:hypothetical protein
LRDYFEKRCHFSAYAQAASPVTWLEHELHVYWYNNPDETAVHNQKNSFLYSPGMYSRNLVTIQPPRFNHRVLLRGG